MEIRSSTLWLALVTVAACGSDGPSKISVSSPVSPAGEEGDVVITLHREGGGGSMMIPFATSDQTATAGADYVGTTGMVEWKAGDFEDKTITITLMDDVIVESSETFGVTLGKASNGSTIDQSDLTATITDDDHPGDSFAATSNGRLMHFDRAQPGRFCFAVQLSGLAAGENVIALDMRPNDGKLYGLTDGAQLYTIDPSTGAATLKSTLVADPADTSAPFNGLKGTAFGIDFNPITDRLRLTSDQGQNLRIDVDTGRVITDPAISGQTTGYSAIAHNNNVAASCRTRLYAIDATGNRFVMQSPDEGTTEGAGGLRLTATATAGFDIYTDEMDKDAAVAGLAVNGDVGMYKIDLGTGEATAVREKVGPLDAGESMTTFALGTLPATTPAAQELGELFGVTASTVVSFNRQNPQKLCSTATITGLDPGETILDVDMQPSTGVLYALTKVGSAGRLHRVDPYGGTLSPPVAISVPLSGTTFGTDFSPVGNAPLRIVSDTGQNILVTDMDTGAATAGPALHGAGTAATGAAYTDAVLGAGTATLYVIDPATDRLSLLNPTTGVLTDVGALGTDITKLGGLDIDGRNNLGFVASTVGTHTELHTLDVRTGALSPSLGTVGTATPLVGMTRATPEVYFYGVTTEGKLIRFDINDPSNITVVTDPMRMMPTDVITGLGPNEYLVAVDFTPGPNMYGITNIGNLYSVNSSIADATKLGSLHADPSDTSSPFSALSGTAFDVDFDPTGNVPMRIVSDAQQNLHITQLMPPMVVTDPTLSSSSAMGVTGAAYTNSYAGATSSTLYAIDGASSRLMVESTRDSGNLTAVGPLGVTGKLAGFDIGGGNNGIALAGMQLSGESFTRLYRIDLATGAATQVGNGIGGAPLRSLSIYIR
ncbi:MAG: DUF4394 domain-containing protein [Deltaproteobacteria bacterium]|nr:DUF4394 domain-containing protein [Deltaproteobacteria bacterium]